jgi:hypothetical protein
VTVGGHGGICGGHLPSFCRSMGRGEAAGVNTRHMGVKEGAMGYRSVIVRVWWPFLFTREPLTES